MDKEIKLNWGIPISWLDVKLDDIAIIIQGQSPPSSTYNNEQIGLPFFQGKAEFTDLHPVVKVWCKAPTKIAEPNDILLSVRAPVGSTNLANVKCGIGRGLSAIRYQYAHKFVFYYLRLIERELDKRGTGTTFKAISGDVVRNTHIPLPPLNEQNRIVDKLDELLSELEKGKEQLQTSLEQLKVYRQSILKHAFEGKLTNETVKDGKLPKSWSIKLVSDLCDVVRGGSPRPAGDPRYYGGNIPFLKVADLTKDDKVYVNTYEYTIKEAGLKKTRQIKPNTLLLTNSGATLGVPKISKIDATMNDGIAAFLNLDERSIHYMYYFWRSKTKELRGLNQGAAQPNLNTDIIKNYKVPYCSFEEQQLIVDAIESRFSESEKLEEEIQSSILKLDSLRSSILQKAFEGKLVEQDPTDEPARVLLERIKKEREEYLKAEKERKKTEKPLHIKSRKMAEELKRIIEILKESKEPVSAKTLWQSSTHKDDIDDFYAALKKHIEAGEIIELPRKGKESFLKLADAK